MSISFNLELNSDGFVEAEQESKSDEAIPKLGICYRAYPSWHNSTELDRIGAYVLVDTKLDAKKKWKVYIGEAARGGVAKRLATHSSNSHGDIKNWTYAIAIYGSLKNGRFQRLSPEIAYGLEHFLAALFDEKDNVNLVNTNVPSEPPLKREQNEMIDNFIDSVVYLLKVLGCDLDIQSQKPSRSTPRKQDTPPAPSLPKKRIAKQKRNVKPISKTTLTDLVNTGLLSVGQRLKSSRPKWPAEAEIVDDRGGVSIQVHRYGMREEDGTFSMNAVSESEKSEWRSTKPSYTAGKVRRGGSTNGWDFFKLAGTKKTLADIRAAHDKR